MGSPDNASSPPPSGQPQPEVTREEPLRHREGVTSGGAAKTLAWAAVSLMGSKLLAFISTLILARLLVPEQFGVVAAGLTIIAVLETGLDLGVGAAVVYEQEQGLSDRMRTAFTLNVLVRMLLIRRFIGITVLKALSATAPALLACVGVVLAAGPCVILMEPDATRLAVSVAAGVAGAFVAAILGAHDVLPEVWSLASSVVRKEGVTQ